LVKAVIFDLWGTLIENGVNPSPSKQVRYFLRLRVQFSEFITTFEDSFMKKDFESLKEAFENVVKDFNIKIPDFVYDKMVGMWNKNAILSTMYEETEKILKQLKKEGYKIYLLANIDRFAYDQVNQKFKLDKLFDNVFKSYETGFLKSDKQAYLQIVEEAGVKPEEVIVVGDCLNSDMAGAENAGLKGILVDRRDMREYERKIVTLSELPEFLKNI